MVVEILEDFLELSLFIFVFFSFWEISTFLSFLFTSKRQESQPQPKVRLELKNPETPQGQVADLALEPLRMWTKSPWWDQIHSWI